MYRGFSELQNIARRVDMDLCSYRILRQDCNINVFRHWLAPLLYHTYLCQQIMWISSQRLLNMTKVSLRSYQYEDLPNPPSGSFKITEISAENDSDPVSCSLHITDWQNPQEYDALSYAWGDVNAKATVICQGRKLEITQNLYKRLAQLRYQNCSRFLFADAIWWGTQQTSNRRSFFLSISW